MKSSIKLVLVALVSAVLTGGAVYTYFRTTAGPRPETELSWELAGQAKDGGVPVVLEWDSPASAVKDALRLDVRDELVAEGEKLIPLADLEAALNAV